MTRSPRLASVQSAAGGVHRRAVADDRDDGAVGRRERCADRHRHAGAERAAARAEPRARAQRDLPLERRDRGHGLVDHDRVLRQHCGQPLERRVGAETSLRPATVSRSNVCVVRDRPACSSAMASSRSAVARRPGSRAPRRFLASCHGSGADVDEHRSRGEQRLGRGSGESQERRSHREHRIVLAEHRRGRSRVEERQSALRARRPPRCRSCRPLRRAAPRPRPPRRLRPRRRRRRRSRAGSPRRARRQPRGSRPHRDAARRTRLGAIASSAHGAAITSVPATSTTGPNGGVSATLNARATTAGISSAVRSSQAHFETGAATATGSPPSTGSAYASARAGQPT